MTADVLLVFVLVYDNYTAVNPDKQLTDAGP